MGSIGDKVSSAHNFGYVCDSFAANDPSPAKVSERNGEREVLCTFLIEVVGGWEEVVE